MQDVAQLAPTELWLERVAEIQEMSDLILDLEPRVTIADDPDLKARYTKASKTYSDVLELAVERGLKNPRELTHPWFRPLRASPGFRALVERLQSRR